MTKRLGSPGALPYRPELDGIRTLAIAGVLLFHAALLLPFRLWGGEFGVDLFFVLSGLLITTLLLAEHDRTRSIDLGAFCIRRVLRLVPALLLLLIAGSFVAVAVHSQTDGLAFWPAAVTALLGVGNWFQASTHKLGLLVHTWSLAIEWQFYLLWPMVLFTALRRGTSRHRLALYATGAAALVAVTRSVVYHHVGIPQAMFWTVTRADGVLIGSALALAITHGGRVVEALRRTDVTLVAAVGAGFGVANLHAATRWMFDGGLFLLVCCFAIVIGHVTIRSDGAFGRALRVAPLPQIGKISYGVYLFHLPVFKLVFQSPGRRSLAWVAAAALATLAVAAISYVVVEQPALRLRSTLRTWLATRRRAAVSDVPVADPSRLRPVSRLAAPSRRRAPA